MVFIKIFSESTAAALFESGFDYTTETYGKKLVYVFPKTNELMHVLENILCLKKTSYYSERSLNFG